MIQVAEAYAEGTASLEELADAHDAVDGTAADEAVAGAAVEAVFWLSPDDYKVFRGLDCATDAAGYLRAIAAGVLHAGATRNEGKAIWKHPAFLAGKEPEERAVCDLIRHVIGNPFRPASLAPAWLTPAVLKLAKAAYDNQLLPSGLLDNTRLSILADALEEAGCTNAETLSHLRGSGPHVRGCWALDRLLGKG
jgi:hypothetical protein